jgi:hypothetical protein
MDALVAVDLVDKNWRSRQINFDNSFDIKCFQDNQPQRSSSSSVASHIVADSPQTRALLREKCSGGQQGAGRVLKGFFFTTKNWDKINPNES